MKHRKILKLETQNVKCLKAVEIVPQGNTVVIGGNNGHGKSSVLDSILYALQGKGAVCDEPIRKGEKKAKIICTLDDLKITRTFTTKGGGELTVENADGAPMKSPQSLLNQLYGKVGFDPLEFERMDSKKQLETLREIVGLDFSELDEKRSKKYEQRTDVNKAIKRLKTGLDGCVKYPDAPAAEISVDALLAEMGKAEDKNRSNENDRRAHQVNIEAAEKLKAEIAQKQKALVELTAQIDRGKESVQRLQDEDTDTIKTQISDAQRINEQVRANQEYEAAQDTLKSEEARAEKLTDAIKAIDEEKEKLLSEANLPIKGLSFAENGVLYEGIPFEQCSSAQRLIVAVAIGLAANPSLRVIIIKDGSLLDANSLQRLAQYAAENDAQIWIERVGKGQECQVIIEDGEVQSALRESAA